MKPTKRKRDRENYTLQRLLAVTVAEAGLYIKKKQYMRIMVCAFASYLIERLIGVNDNGSLSIGWVDYTYD